MDKPISSSHSQEATHKGNGRTLNICHELGPGNGDFSLTEAVCPDPRHLCQQRLRHSTRTSCDLDCELS